MFLVTNHLNLLFMLGAGLLLPASGFGEKYYKDTLEVAPGWIPLFTGRPDRAAIASVQAEADHLRPCQVVISLRECSGIVMVPTASGVAPRRWPEDAGGWPPLIFVPAPLPISAIQEVLFRTVADKGACQAKANDYGNVALKDFKLRTDKRAFTGASSAAWPPPHRPEDRDPHLGPAQAAGGMLALLRQLANRTPPGEPSRSGESLTLATCRVAFDPDGEPTVGPSRHVARDLPAWIKTGEATKEQTLSPGHDAPHMEPRRLFWLAVNAVAPSAGATTVHETRATLLAFVGKAAEDMDPADRLKAPFNDLRQELDSLEAGFANHTLSDLFRRFKTPLPRAILLLFLRSSAEELLDFRHEALNEDDRVAAGVLFGACFGWLGLPTEVRGKVGTAAISHRMAALSHRREATGFALGPAPGRPPSLPEVFADKWNARQKKAAVELSRQQEWNCLRTEVRLPLGEHQLQVGPGGVTIAFDGEPQTVETTVDRDDFGARLASVTLSPEAEARVMEMLGEGRREKNDRTSAKPTQRSSPVRSSG